MFVLPVIWDTTPTSVVPMKDGDDVSYRQFRLMMTRDGIISVE